MNHLLLCCGERVPWECYGKKELVPLKESLRDNLSKWKYDTFAPYSKNKRNEVD